MIKITVEEKKSLKPFNKGWWNFTKVEWAPVLLEENKPFWELQTDSYRRPWVALDPGTKDLDGFLLRETGEMFNTAVVRPWGSKFIVDTTTYGAIHQLGTKKVPARPWMGVPDSALDRLPSIAWKHILN
jgi:phage gpG-like protein